MKTFEKLVRVSTYGKKHDISVTEVHRRIKSKAVKSERIDKVWFIYDN